MKKEARAVCRLPVEREATYRVQSVERAIDILDCFTYQTKELALPDIIQKTGLNRSTARRLVSNLTCRGLLQFDSGSKRYRLGLRLFEMGGIVFSSFSLRKAAASPMSHLEHEIGATTLLGKRMEDQFVYIDKREGHGMISMPSEIGLMRPLSYGLFGRIFMAFLGEGEVKRILKKFPLKPYTPYSITDPDAFSLELARIRKRGYGIDVEEFAEGIMGIAAPIRDYSNQVIAALCAAVPASRRRDKKYIDKVVGLVRKTCEDISTNLGHLEA